MARAVRTMMDYIRKHYNVPAKRGVRVETAQGKGYITGSGGACYVRVKLDGETKTKLFHPTDIKYLESVA